MEAISDFAINSYKLLCSASKKDEVYSPLSAAIALGMVMQGARGKTLANVGRMLLGRDVDETELEKVENELKELMEVALKGNEGVMDMANLIYGQKDFAIKTSYLLKLFEVFQVKEFKQLDLPSEGKTVINGDVSKATRDKIPEIISKDIHPNTFMILVNAIYFNGKWKNSFNKNHSRKEDFTTISNIKKQVWMMYQQRQDIIYAYSGELKAQAVLLPYKDGSIQMMIILPDEGATLNDLEAQLTGKSLTHLLNSMHQPSAGVKLWLPRFKIESSFDLKSMICHLGAGDMFDSVKANFAGITDEPTAHVSSAIQKALIQVDEEGTVAAAITMIEVHNESAPRRRPPQPKVVRCDRPFLYMLLVDPKEIKKAKSDAPVIFFVGAVRDPPAAV